MVQLLSKLAPIEASCVEYAHPWSDSCLKANFGAYLYIVKTSFRVYVTFYVLRLLMGCQIPTKDSLKKALQGILKSTLFLSSACGLYFFFICAARKLLGHFYFFTVAAVPAFLASILSIFIERPSRRLLLTLYLTNHAMETIWNMAVVRNMVRPVKYGEIAIFSFSTSVLMYYYKSGVTKKSENAKRDSVFNVLSFVLGPYEEKISTARSNQTDRFHRQHIVPNRQFDSVDIEEGSPRSNFSDARNTIYHLMTNSLKAYKNLIQKIKCLDKHPSCAHPFSCLYYTMQGAAKMFGFGLSIQIALKLVLNAQKIIISPKSIRTIAFKNDNLGLGMFLGGFAGVFRGLCCILRRVSGNDHPWQAIPAGLIAGIAFMQYPNTTIAIYMLLKVVQITYNLGIDKGVLPNIPRFSILLYCLSTTILLHAAHIEPGTLRPSYWKFIHLLSGGRVSCMDQKLVDVWGLETSKMLRDVLQQTNSKQVVEFYNGGATWSP